jgi:acid phosphatase
MEYLNNLISKWMPPHSPRVGVNSHPSIVGILDTTNATLAHGTATRLPKEFYDVKGLKILDRIGTDAWFAGYKESSEFRTLGIGPLLGDMVSRMVSSVPGASADGQSAKSLGREWKIKFALFGAHDTTLAGILASLGAFEGENGEWPPYTSHIAMELFRKSNTLGQESALKAKSDSTPWYWFFRPASIFGAPKTQKDANITRKPHRELSMNQKKSLAGYYVRLRYNDRPIVIQGCKAPGNHLEGDESFCTLVCSLFRHSMREWAVPPRPRSYRPC